MTSSIQRLSGHLLLWCAIAPLALASGRGGAGAPPSAKEKLAQLRQAMAARRTGRGPAAGAGVGSARPAPAKTTATPAAAGARKAAPASTSAPERPSTVIRDRLGREYRLGPGADLSGAQFQGCDLSGLDLSGTKLAGAVFTGANLSGCAFTGADLRGAVLYRANTSGALGLDPAGALLHPFTQPLPGERVGDFRFFLVPASMADEATEIRDLVCLDSGRMAWRSGSNGICQMTPTGAESRLEPLPNTRVLALARDCTDRLWYFGDVNQGAFRPDQPACAVAGGEILFADTQPSRFTEPPLQIQAGARNDLWVSLGAETLHLETVSGGRVRGSRFGHPQDLLPGARTTMTPDRAGAHRFYITEARPAVVIEGPDGAVKTLALPPGGRPRRIAMGAKDEVWATLGGGENAILRIDLGPAGERKDAPLGIFPLPEGAHCDPFGLVLGPDGNLWFTDRTGRIGRVTQEGAITLFPLPKGLRPEEIVRADGGRLLFTLKGVPMIGAILAVAPDVRDAAEGPEGKEEAGAPPPEAGVPPARDPGVVAASWAIAPAAPRRARKSKYLKGEARRAWIDGRDRRGEALYAAFLPPEPGPAAAAPGEGKDEAAAETKAPAPSPSSPEGEPGPTAATRLEAFNAYLPRRLAWHTLSKHGHGRMPGKSQFAEAFSDVKAFRDLVAQGVEDAGGLDGHLTWDGEGRIVTRCEREGVGRVFSGGALKPTDAFIILSERYWNEETGEFEYVIFNAYPVE